MADYQDDAGGRLSVLCWNIGNPAIERAGKQLEWLLKRPEHVLVLTEAKMSDGCSFMQRCLQAYGYHVVFPKPVGGEYATMVGSRHPLTPTCVGESVGYLPSRVASAILTLRDGSSLELIGVYVPSRDASYGKIERKKTFLSRLDKALGMQASPHGRMLCGDLNVLEPDHDPSYAFFQPWEYDFYNGLGSHGLIDAYRVLNPGKCEYSWVGKTGDGYRYDHCFISSDLTPRLEQAYYIHETRERRLSDHSALVTVLRT